MANTIACPFCGKLCVVPDAAPGAIFQCPMCDAQFEVPGPDLPASHSPAPVLPIVDLPATPPDPRSRAKQKLAKSPAETREPPRSESLAPNHWILAAVPVLLGAVAIAALWPAWNTLALITAALWLL